MAGRQGWRFPLTFAEHVGLEDGETRILRPSRPELGEDIWIARRSGTCVGGPIDGPLGHLEATPGDLVFFTTRADWYAMVLRRQSEMHDAGPMRRLLWSCGLDPRDSDMLAEPWLRLARALGGAGGNSRDEVRRRLEHRGDDSLLGLLEEVGRSRSEDEGFSRTPWPECWQYRLPLADHTSLPALRGIDKTIRVALGVLDTSNQRPRELLLGDGDLLWLHQSLAADPDDVIEVLRTPPRGLVPAAHRQGWASMVRLEHAARRLALAGEEWSIAVLDGGWHMLGRSYPSLLEALETLEDPADDVVPGPAKGVQTPYPRSVAAVRSAAEEAAAAGLRAVVADPAYGFRAEYVAHDIIGAALHDILLPA